MPTHEQAWAKVNVHVDRGVAGLVEALSLFPYVQTLESCEGAPDKAAWICFFYGRYWNDPYKELAEFVLGFLGPRLAAEVGDGARLSVRVTESGNVLGEIAVSKTALADVESALRRLASDFSRARS